MMSGIPPSVWIAEGDRAIETAFDLLSQRESRKSGRKTSG